MSDNLQMAHQYDGLDGIKFAILHLADVIETALAPEVKVETTDPLLKFYEDNGMRPVMEKVPTVIQAPTIEDQIAESEYPDKHPWDPFYDGQRKRHCWKRGRIHMWGKKKGWFNGRHWFKVCMDCKAMRITYHVNCDIKCATGDLG